MKLCPKCSQPFTPRKQNGINISKFCSDCQWIIKKEKHQKQVLKRREERKKETRKRKREDKSKSNLVFGKKVWATFIKYLKAKKSKGKEYACCYTCGRQFSIKELQGGHFKHRGRTKWKAIDFEFNHIQLQCSECNFAKSGEEYEFGKRLEQDFGEEWVREIIYRRNTEEPLTYEQLLEIKDKYEKLYDELQHQNSV